MATLKGDIDIQKISGYYNTASFICGREPGLSDGKTVSSSLQNDGSFESTISDLTPNRTYYYRALVTVNHDSTFLGEIKWFTTKKPAKYPPSRATALGTFITREDGSQYELFWANCNLGDSGLVNSPEEYGARYAWGETETKQDYSWSTYKWCDGNLFLGYPQNITKYNSSDNKTILETGPEGDDAASKILGGKWRMPTYEELTELRKICTWTWTDNYNDTGVMGRIVSSKIEGYTDKKIFLPAESNGIGSYWSSSLDVDNSSKAWDINFDSSTLDRNRYFHGHRRDGYHVRPVTE